LISDETQSDPAFAASALAGVSTAAGSYWLFGQDYQRSGQLGLLAAALAFVGLSTTEQDFGFLVTIKQYTKDDIRTKLTGIEDIETVREQLARDWGADTAQLQKEIEKITTSKFADFKDNSIAWPRSLKVKTEGNMIFTSESARTSAAAERFLKDYPKWVFPTQIY
jgi:hypothetical protein